MLKKLLLTLGIILLSISSTYAVDTVFYAPDISMLPSSINVGTASNNDRIAVNSNSRNQFCLEFGGTYTTHVVGYSLSDRARYIPSTGLWMNQANTNVLDTLTCDIPEPTSSGGGLGVDGLIGSGSLDIITINNGKIYIEQDNFYYLFVSLIVIALLFRTVVFTFIKSVNFGKNLTKGKLSLNK